MGVIIPKMDKLGVNSLRSASPILGSAVLPLPKPQIAEVHAYPRVGEWNLKEVLQTSKAEVYIAIP
jgi:hypothetical protein